MTTQNSASARLLTWEQTELRIASRTASVEETVREAYQAALASRFDAGAAVVAVGGFGRAELFPQSDVDVLVLIGDKVSPGTLKEGLGIFVQSLWDAKLRLSQSVRTVADCCQLHAGNTELSISLLDSRFLAGDRALFDQLDAGLPKLFRLHGQTLARHLAKLTRERHSKFQNTIYHLEPSLKETPGGLRDLHVVHWMTRLNPVEAPPDLADARAFLFPLRYRLHERSGRDDNVLDFEAQDEISSHPEEMMRNYFRHARSVHRAAIDLVEHSEERESSLLGQFRDWRSRLSNSDFTVSRERLYVRGPQRLQTDADLVWRLFQFAGRHGLRLARETERRLLESLPGLNSMGWEPVRDLFQQPKLSIALRAMEDIGALPAVVPEWKRIECLVVRDFYHRYTVDEHTLVALQTLENLDDRRFSDLASEIDPPWVLRIALLLHDIGKGTGNHVEEGLRLARKITERLGVPAQEAATILFLIEQHLVLSSVMSSRDLDDPETARMLADKVGTVERLKMLTLLTFADISAVNPTAMTPWRKEQLWRTYLLVHDELTRELDTDRIHALEIASPEMAAFLEGLPTRYLRTHTETEIRAHYKLWDEAQRSEVAIDIDRQSGYYRLAVATPDRPFLFACISGGLAAFGLNILKAEAFANARGFILDTFTFADPLRTLELNPTEIHRLRDVIQKVILAKEDVRRLLRNRPKPARRPARIHSSIAFNDEASPAATLIEIIAEDRPGLLFDLASAMSDAGCNIEVVLIDTEAQKAFDVFYVTSGGAKLSPERRDLLREALVMACSG